MSRLLTLLLYYRAGYIVCKYISIEKLIENSKETYYEALQASSRGPNSPFCGGEYMALFPMQVALYGGARFINPAKNLVVAIASLFNPVAKDRIELIKKYIEPIFED